MSDSTTREPVSWRCPPTVAKRFVALLEQAQFEHVGVPETIDRVRSLPGFPIDWRPGQPIRIIITAPAERPRVVQVPRGMPHR